MIVIAGCFIYAYKVVYYNPWYRENTIQRNETVTQLDRFAITAAIVRKMIRNLMTNI